MRKLIASAAVAGMVTFAACDDGRQDRIPGAEPGAVVPEAETPWDTLHPPVPPAPGVEGQGTGPGETGTPGARDVTTPPPMDGSTGTDAGTPRGTTGG